MVADKVFDYPEVGYYARFPRASKICKSGNQMPTKSASTPRLTQCTAFAVPPLIANICSNAKALPTSRQRDGAVDLHARSVAPLKVRCPPKMLDHSHCDTVSLRQQCVAAVQRPHDWALSAFCHPTLCMGSHLEHSQCLMQVANRPPDVGGTAPERLQCRGSSSIADHCSLHAR
jgi:hypothetical protein